VRDYRYLLKEMGIVDKGKLYLSTLLNLTHCKIELNCHICFDIPFGPVHIFCEIFIHSEQELRFQDVQAEVNSVFTLFAFLCMIISINSWAHHGIFWTGFFIN